MVEGALKFWEKWTGKEDQKTNINMEFIFYLLDRFLHFQAIITFKKYALNAKIRKKDFFQVSH